MPTYQLPRGPVSYGKSGRADYPDNYVKSIMQYRDAAREEAINTLQLNPEYSETQRYIDFIEGRHWNADRPRYRSKFFDNRIAEARTDSLSQLTDIRPTIDVHARVKSYQSQAEIAKNTIHHEWFNMDLDLALVSAVDHALFGVGYWKMGAILPGRMVVTPCGMDTVLPIQPGWHLQDSSGVLYRTYKNIQYFRNIWRDRADGLEAEAASAFWASNNNEYVRPGHIAEYTWNSLSPQMRYLLGVKQTRRRAPGGNYGYFPVLELEEYWIDDPSINESSEEVVVQDPNLSLDEHNYWYRVKPGERLYPRKRLLVFGGDRHMHDGPSPYWHGLYPFAQLRLNPYVWGPGGLSKYRNLLPLNQSINRIGAGTEDVIDRAIKPQLITKEGAVRDATWQKFFPDRPGGKLKMAPIANVTDVRYIDPPVLPGYVFQFMQGYLLPTFDRRSGKLDVNQLGRKRQAPGGDTIEQMRDSMQTSFRLESRYIEAFLRDAGQMAVSNIFQFYTMEQRMKLLGPNGIDWHDFDYDPNSMVPYSQPKEDHWRMFPIQITPGSLHGASKDREKTVAITLYKMGAISRRQLLRTLEVGNVDQIEREIHEEREAGIGPAVGGRTPRMTRGQRTGSPV